jgi:hypothetical protein
VEGTIKEFYNEKKKQTPENLNGKILQDLNLLILDFLIIFQRHDLER